MYLSGGIFYFFFPTGDSSNYLSRFPIEIKNKNDLSLHQSEITLCAAVLFLARKGVFTVWDTCLQVYLHRLVEMIKSVHQILLYAGLFSEAVLLLVSISYCYRDMNPKYLRTFPIFCLFELCADLILILFGMNSVAGNITANLLTLCELAYLSYFLNQLIQSGVTKKIMGVLIILFYIHFSTRIVTYGIGHYYEDEVFGESLILIIPSLVFLKEIFSREFKSDLSREPAFWIVTGILFYFTTIIPLILCRAYFALKGMWELREDISVINNFSTIVSNVLFIKGCTCRMKK